jgi:GntR family transcriptional regulator
MAVTSGGGNNVEIRLSSSDGVPVYRQIISQVKYMVASGRLRAGQELPTIRALAERLVINPNTVVKAYSELQHEGIVEMRHGSGTYIRETANLQPARDATRRLGPRADALLADAAHLNLELEDVIELVRERHALLTKGTKA